MMKNTKYLGVSQTALIICLLPLLTFIPNLLGVHLTDEVRTIWAGLNIVFVLVGLILSFSCVKNKESRNILNLISTIISSIWTFMIIGIVAVTLFINFL